MRKTAIGITLLILITSMLLSTTFVYAIGVGTSPGRYDLTLKRGEATTVTLGVTNTGQTESVYQVYLDEEEYTPWFSFKPNELVLPAKGSGEVAVKIKAPLLKTGTHTANISVVSLVKGDGMGVGAGIKVPVTIEVSSRIALNVIIIGIVIVVVIAAVIAAFIAYRKRRIAY